MESLVNFYYIDIDKCLDIEYESNYEFIDINDIDSALPYQKSIRVIYRRNKKRT